MVDLTTSYVVNAGGDLLTLKVSQMTWLSRSCSTWGLTHYDGGYWRLFIHNVIDRLSRRRWEPWREEPEEIILFAFRRLEWKKVDSSDQIFHPRNTSPQQHFPPPSILISAVNTHWFRHWHLHSIAVQLTLKYNPIPVINYSDDVSTSATCPAINPWDLLHRSASACLLVKLL